METFLTEFDLKDITLPAEVIVAGIVLASLVVMFLIKHFFIRRLIRFTDSTNLFYATLLAHSIRFPLTILILVVQMWLLNWLLAKFGITNESYSDSISLASKVLLIAAIAIFLSLFTEGALGRYAQNSDALRSSGNIIKGVVKGVILGIGVLIILGTLGISITPIIASLGITSLAVALALQPTLGNFFSGVQLVMDKPIRVGDFIELESGEQGFVERIGWRSTWIRMLPNNTVIMPNSKMSESKIINYYYPTKELSVPVEVGVHYNSDLEHVERVTLDVAREILKSHKWGIGDYETFVIYHTFDSSSINFTVMLRTEEYFHRFFLKSEFIKALHKRYAEEGIVIPYPIRAINTDQEHAVVTTRTHDSAPNAKSKTDG